MSKANTNGKMRFQLKFKAAMGLILLSFMLISGTSYLSYKNMERKYEEFYDETAQATAQSAAAAIDGDEATKALESMEYSPELQESLAQMDVIKKTHGAKYLYLFSTYTGEGYTYIYTSMVEGDDSADMLPLGYFEPYSGGSAVTDEVVETGLPSKTDIYKDKNWGHIVNCFAPVTNSAGETVALVGVDYDINLIMDQVYDSVISIALWISALVTLLILIFLIFTNRILVKPILALTQSAKDFVNSTKDGGSLEHTPLELKNNDEIGDLALSFNTMASDLEAHTRDLARVTAENERISTELSVATKIQDMFLPKIFPPFTEHDGFSLFAIMTPAKEVGGDFYDFFKLDDDHYCFCVSDVAGKGVPAALFMVVSKTVLKNLCLNGKTPSEVMYEANNQLSDGNDENMFVTSFLGILEISTGKFTYTNAGHPKPIICHQDGTCEFLPCSGHMALAALSDLPYGEDTITLSVGDRLIIYSDGVDEATNEHEELFGDERLLECAKTSFNDRSLEIRQAVKAVYYTVQNFQTPAPQFDDITILGVEYEG